MVPSWLRQRRKTWASPLVVLGLFPAGCALAYDYSGYEAAPPVVPSLEAGAIDASLPDSAPPTPATIRLYREYHAWSDGTYAPSCEAYLHPASTSYAYEGVTGSGVYAVKPARAESPILVLCDMTASGEGWTLITTSSYEERARGAATTQTLGCVSATAYCNVASDPWDYEMLRQTWSGCPGAEARITKTAFQDDANACNNQVDSLLLTFNVPTFVGLKAWADCSFECLGQSWFAGQSLTPGYPTLLTDAKFVTSKAGGLVSLPASKSCTAESYACQSGYDSIWLR